MLSKEILQKVNRVIVHGQCPDGMASAFILWDALGIEPEFHVHGTPEYLELKAGPNMLFCDIAPPKDRYYEFAAFEAIVLDHHKKSEELVKKFKYGVFADEDLDPGVSGATLAYREVWNVIKQGEEGSEMSRLLIKDIAELIGIADTWQSNHFLWEKARIAATTFSFYPWEHWKHRGTTTNLQTEFDTGALVFNNRQEVIKRCAREVFTFKHAGYVVGIFNDLGKYTSDVAEVLRSQGYNVVAGFSCYTNKDNHPMIRFSLRSDGSLDVSDLAQHIDPNGGGHTKAAGCSAEINSPYLSFKDWFEGYIFTKGEYL